MSKYTQIYSTAENGELWHYVRFCPVETNQYPHGLALATKCKTKEEAARFQSLVDKYIETWLGVNNA